MPFVYILYSEKIDRYYVGACKDLQRRLYEHNIEHSGYTKVGVPWRLVFQQEFIDLPTAKKREAEIKKMKSRKYIENLIGG